MYRSEGPFLKSDRGQRAIFKPESKHENVTLAHFTSTHVQDPVNYVGEESGSAEVMTGLWSNTAQKFNVGMVKSVMK